MVPILALLFNQMPIPKFAQTDSADICFSRISDNVRLARREIGISQIDFAKKCDIPIRTFKRFETGQCDSLLTFIKIVSTFERIAALNLLFPTPQVEIRTRNAVQNLANLRKAIKK